MSDRVHTARIPAQESSFRVHTFNSSFTLPCFLGASRGFLKTSAVCWSDASVTLRITCWRGSKLISYLPNGEETSIRERIECEQILLIISAQEGMGQSGHRPSCGLAAVGWLSSALPETGAHERWRERPVIPRDPTGDVGCSTTEHASGLTAGASEKDRRKAAGRHHRSPGVPPARPGERLLMRGAALGRDPEGPECGRRSGAGVPSSSRRRALGPSGNKPTFGSPGGRGGARGPFSEHERLPPSSEPFQTRLHSLPHPRLAASRSQIHTSFMSRSLAGEIIPAGADLQTRTPFPSLRKQECLQEARG